MAEGAVSNQSTTGVDRPADEAAPPTFPRTLQEPNPPPIVCAICRSAQVDVISSCGQYLHGACIDGYFRVNLLEQGIRCACGNRYGLEVSAAIFHYRHLPLVNGVVQIVPYVNAAHFHIVSADVMTLRANHDAVRQARMAQVNAETEQVRADFGDRRANVQANLGFRLPDFRVPPVAQVHTP